MPASMAAAFQQKSQCSILSKSYKTLRHTRSSQFIVYSKQSSHAEGAENRQNKNTTMIKHAIAKQITAFATAAAFLLPPATQILDIIHPKPAEAVLSAPNARIARSVDAALRRSIPAFNENVRIIQTSLEDIAFKLRIPQRKPWAAMQQSLDSCISIASDDSAMLRGVLPADTEQAKQLLTDIQSDLNRLTLALTLKDPDKTSIRLSNALERVGNLELLQAPGLSFGIPQQYANLPRLTGRAIVELSIERPDGRAIFIDPDSEDGPQKRAKLELTVDGYSAPLSAGNFVANVLAGVYNNTQLSVSPISILVGQQGKNIGAIPLEMLPIGGYEPVYRSPLDVLDGELPVLPLSIKGAVAYAHLPGTEDNNVGYVSSRQFFLYLYNRASSGLSGLSFDEGQFGVFAYVTKGTEVLSKLEDRDKLISAKVVQGQDKLVVPASTNEAPTE